MTAERPARALFLGDICLQRRLDVGPPRPPLLDAADVVVANLEGPVLTDREAERQRRSGRLALYSTTAVMDILHRFNVSAVSLANNHTYDVPRPAAATAQQLRGAGIRAFGAGQDLKEASEDLRFDVGETSIRVVGFGWPVIGCRPAGTGREGVNPWDPDHALRSIRRIRARDPSSFVVFFVHWNYELEPYPQPADRQLARVLIEEGVDAVVGLHPHVVGGAEFFGGKVVAYSLGNWFFPPTRMGRLDLSFPPSTRLQLALELVVRGRELIDARFHWYDFDSRALEVEPVATEGPDGDRLRELVPWDGASHSDYVAWFKSHRRRRHGLPVYPDFRHRGRNALRDAGVRVRDRIIRGLVQIGLKSGPRE